MKPAVLALLGLVAAVRADAAADPARYMKAELVSESLHPKPGSTILIAIKMTPKPGWHGYWSNPGDSGIAPSGTWSTPKGVKVGPLLHPAPSLMVSDGIASFVHSGPHMLVSKLQISPEIRRGAHIPVIANLSWAACTPTQCVPLKARLRLELIAGNGAASGNAPLIRAAAARLPRRAPDATYVRAGKTIRLTLPASTRLDSRKSLFFPDDSAPFDVARTRPSRRGGHVVLAIPLRSAPPATFGGVVSDGVRAYRIAFHRAGH